LGSEDIGDTLNLLGYGHDAWWPLGLFLSSYDGVAIGRSSAKIF
jgi:hypothetical protein